MAGRLSLSVSELTVRDKYGRVNKKYRMLNHNDVIASLAVLADGTKEEHTRNNVNALIRMIADLNPNV